MAVGYKRSANPAVLQMPNNSLWIRRIRRLPDLVRGLESFCFPGTSRLLEMTPKRPDVLHCHNLHGNYFDLTLLPWLSSQLPVLLTVHDAWLTTGHCAHSLGCERWLSGCGHCPDLTIYPRIWCDGTAANWERKRNIYSNSKVWITAPSRWLIDWIQRSILCPAVIDMRVIPNGIDLTVFNPGDRTEARQKLRLPLDADVLVFSAIRKRGDAWRDYTTIQNALREIGSVRRNRRIVCVAVGEEARSREFGAVEVRHLPYMHDPNSVADLYRAADMYIHASLADTFPNTVIEAQACGTPVIATATGGIPEQIADGATGLLIPIRDGQAMTVAIKKLVENDFLRKEMAGRAADRARRFYGLDQHVQAYLNLYFEMIDSFASERTHKVSSRRL